MAKYIYALFVILLIFFAIWLKQAIEARNEAVKHITAIVNAGNKEAPKAINDFAKFVGVRRDKLDVIYEYEITSAEFPFDIKEYYSMQLQNFIRIMCDTPKIRSIVLDEGVQLMHRYLDKSGQEMQVFIFSKNDCGNGT